jgi:lipopolysaccharide/colanic/teichoic acid biosynthesis glycosyltransferase
VSGRRGYPGKRALDLLVAIPLAMLLLAPAVLVALAIAATTGTPVLFRHRRAGLAGRPFLLYKFRTMREAGEGESDADRITGLGRLLRATSLDEIPQLWNVLRGDMSLVGPRPLLPEYLGRYTAEQARRHEVLPGITGLAQVSGRNAIGWDRKFELDREYVDQQGLGLDLRILARTLGVVLSGSGVSADGHATMPEFGGERVAGRSAGDAPLPGGAES